MKKIFIACAAVLMFAACGSKTHYAIDGVTTDPSFEGCYVYLYANRTAFDSAVVEQGTFHFEGEAAETILCGLYIINNDETNGSSLTMALEPGTIHVDLDRDSIYGTPLNDAYNACLLRHDYKSINHQIEVMEMEYQQADPVEIPALTKTFDKYYEEVFMPCRAATLRDLMESNKDNVWGPYAAVSLAYHKLLNSQELEQLMADTNSVFSKDTNLTKMLDQMRHFESTSEGHSFTDFACILPNGEKGMMSEVIKGKLTLMDFWASWCAPCREEISTNLIRLSKEYGKKGLLVVGVDVWDDIDRHAAAVEQLGIPYPQVIDTTKNATDIYGISGIPQIMLIGADGTILARDLRGDEIEEAIIEALK